MLFTLLIYRFEQPKRSAKVDTHNTKNAIDLENKYDALSS